MVQSRVGAATLAVLLAAALGAVGGCILIGDFAPLASGPAVDASLDSPADGSGPACSPGERRSCYAGPASAAGVGVCLRGSQACLPDRSGYGACEGSVLPRAEKCDTKDVDESCDGEPACTGAPRLQIALGDGLDQRGTAIAIDDAGDVFIAGTFAGTLDTHGGATVVSGGTSEVDGFLLKMSPSGQVKWATRIVDARPEALAVGNGKVALVGATRAPTGIDGCAALPHAGADGFDDILVATLDPDTGRCVAARAIGAALGDVGTAVALDPTNGDVFVGGTIAGNTTVDFGGGLPPLVASLGRDGFAVRMDAALRATALEHLKGGAVDVNAVAVDRIGRAYVGGGWNGSLQVVGQAQTYTSSGQSGFVVSLPQSVQMFSGNRIATVSALRIDASDRLVVGGSFTGELYGTSGAQPDFTSRGNEDGFVAWFLAGGAGALGIVQLGGAGYDRVTALAVDPLSQVLVLGTTTGGVDLGAGPLGPGAGVFLGKLRFKEPLVWGQSFVGQVAVGGVASDPLAGVWMTGWFAKELDLGGPAPLKAATLDPIATDVFVVHRAP